jgi:hypothetical protein
VPGEQGLVVPGEPGEVGADRTLAVGEQHDRGEPVRVGGDELPGQVVRAVQRVVDRRVPAGGQCLGGRPDPVERGLEVLLRQVELDRRARRGRERQQDHLFPAVEAGEPAGQRIVDAATTYARFTASMVSAVTAGVGAHAANIR